MSRDSSPTPHASPGSALEAPFRLGWLAVVVLAALAGAFAVGWFPRRRQREDLGRDTRELARLTVTLVTPSPGQPGGPLTLPAEIRAEVDSPIYARATGYVRRWHADLGASVTNGQVLAELDTPELDEDLANARAQARQAEAALALATTTAARWTQLAASRLVNQQEADEKQADLRLREAALEAARANVHRLETMAGYATIHAPFDGVLTARRVDVGQLVTAGNGTELFHLAQTRKLRVYVRVPQTVAQAVTVGQAAEVLLNERPGQRFPAQVVRTAGALDSASRTLLVELELANPGQALLPGGYAQVRFVDAHIEMPLTVPSNTLLFRPDGAHVGVVGTNEVVEVRHVTLGRDFGPTVEVRQGLSTADRLILNPPDSLASGTAVRIAKAAQAKP